MRFTQVLWKVNYHRHIQRIWKRQGRLESSDLKVPEELQELGVVIEDAKEILNDTKLFPPKKVKPYTLPMPPSVLQPRKHFYVFNNDTKISESENQILSLTKTVPYNGLPTSFSSLIGKDTLPNQDELVQTNMMQALVWDGDQHMLPKVYKKVFEDRLPWLMPRTYGTLNEKKVSGLLEKLAFLCDTATGKYPGCLQRQKLQDAFCGFSIKRNGDDITLNLTADILITSSIPLMRITPPGMVSETKMTKVPDIYPIKCTLDLTKLDTKPECLSIPAFDNKHIHTLLLSQKSPDLWPSMQMMASALATCFSFSAKEAQMKYGVNVKELPEPITVQCAFMDIKSFSFMIYQLNTLDLDHNDGIKNQVWIDEAADLYAEASEKDRITNYNPEIFKKLLAIFMNGLHPVSS